DSLLIMDTRIDEENRTCVRKLVTQAWNLDELGVRYTDFLDRFRPVYQAARGRKKLDPERAFQVRTLLVHEYRKILLRDPLLPESLLPSQWTGVAAYQLCRNLYSLVAAPTERFLIERMETADGPLPPPEPQYFQRFGGLADSQNHRTRS
ncbi:MAG: phenylacetic acid degradation operon negative regulatory protein PaaX, partial [Gammaproteobacteria bacterium]|nr:phenylacetic acid degradation operon negative regulatory protein PaaX [Gammaproteobacteria bacterium]